MPESPLVLIVEDEPSIADTLVYALRTEGFSPRWVMSGREALELVRAEACAFVVLDIGLPDMSGFDVCRELRRFSQVPVLFLTARQAEVDRIVGLELGADDYVVKPFSPREVTARIRAILRRGRLQPVGVPGETVVSENTGLWRVDAEACRIHFQGQPLELTRNEYRLLRTLLGRPGRVFSREALLEAAWEDPGASMDRTVDAHVKSVRAKLRAVDAEADPIETHRGLGYSLREYTGRGGAR